MRGRGVLLGKNKRTYYCVVVYCKDPERPFSPLHVACERKKEEVERGKKKKKKVPGDAPLTIYYYCYREMLGAPALVFRVVRRTRRRHEQLAAVRMRVRVRGTYSCFFPSMPQYGGRCVAYSPFIAATPDHSRRSYSGLFSSVFLTFVAVRRSHVFLTVPTVFRVSEPVRMITSDGL